MTRHLHIWKTSNYGLTWSSIAAGLDSEIYLKVVREDTKKQGLLYLGTERGVMVSHDDGASWQSLRLNMPTVAIADLVVAGDDLVVGSLGRAAFVLDDLTPIREMSDAIADADAHLFKPLDAIRWTYASGPEGGRSGATDNPPKGVTFTYHLAEEPEEDISLVILNAAGNVVRTLSSEAEEPYLAADHPDARPDQKNEADLSKNRGMNRASWDLTHQGATRVPGSTNDAGNMNVGPQVAPGSYRVRLTVNGEDYEQALTVLPDPRSDASMENILAQVAFLLEVRNRITTIADDAVRIRETREQLEVHQVRLGDEPRASRLLEMGRDASEALREVELAIYSPDAQVNYDILAGRHGGAKLYSRYGWLYKTALGHTGPPTQGMTEVNAKLTVLHDESIAELERILSEEIARINSLASELGVDYIVN
ncbi:MAG: hypothetical protein IH910_06350 [Proteobacteria bacterium]|nr:hypothetical protein [Pseudomonadota bacterium]